MKVFLVLLLLLFSYVTKTFAELPNDVRDIRRESWESNLRSSKLGVRVKFILSMRYVEAPIKSYLPIFNNSKAQGNPVYLVNSLELVDGNQKVNFSEVFKSRSSSKLPFNHEEYPFLKFSPVDKRVDIVIEEVENEFMTISKRKQLYFVKPISTKGIDEKDFFFGYVNLLSEGDGKARDLLLNEEKDLVLLIDELKKCATNKDENCFAEKLAVEHEPERQEHVKKTALSNIRQRYIFDDPLACEKLGVMDYTMDNKKVAIDKSKSTLWDSLGKALSLDMNYVYLTFMSNNFNEKYNELQIFKRPRKDLGCDNFEDVVIVLKKNNKKWNLHRFAFSKEIEEIN